MLQLFLFHSPTKTVFVSLSTFRNSHAPNGQINVLLLLHNTINESVTSISMANRQVPSLYFSVNWSRIFQTIHTAELQVKRTIFQPTICTYNITNHLFQNKNSTLLSPPPLKGDHKIFLKFSNYTFQQDGAHSGDTSGNIFLKDKLPFVSDTGHWHIIYRSLSYLMKKIEPVFELLASRVEGIGHNIAAKRGKRWEKQRHNAIS